MKKILCALLLLSTAFSLVSCSQPRSSSENYSMLSIGTYVLQTNEANEDNPSFIPSIVLTEGQHFTFSFSPLLSTIPSGTYNMEEDQLILTSEFEGKAASTYIFNIDGETLIFDRTNSDALTPGLWTDQITAGTPFKLLSHSPQSISED